MIEKADKRFVLGVETAAFHATLNPGQTSHHTIGEIIVFDSVLLNLGGAYDATTGVFTCPMDRVYIFSTSIMSASSTQQNLVHVDIMKNGAEIAAAYASGGSSEQEQGSVSAAVQLVRGDTVWVGYQRHADGHVWGDRLTSFMGVLVTPL